MRYTIALFFRKSSEKSEKTGCCDLRIPQSNSFDLIPELVPHVQNQAERAGKSSQSTQIDTFHCIKFMNSSSGNIRRSLRSTFIPE